MNKCLPSCNNTNTITPTTATGGTTAAGGTTATGTSTGGTTSSKTTKDASKLLVHMHIFRLHSFEFKRICFLT